MLTLVARTWGLLENLLVIAILAAMLASSIVQVILRNFFDSGIDWMEPFQQYALLWLGFLGASIATREKKQISIDALLNILPAGIRHWMRLLPALFAVIVCAVAAWCCWLLLAYEKETADVAFGVIPLWVCVTVMPVSFAVMALRSFAAIIEVFRKVD